MAHAASGEEADRNADSGAADSADAGGLGMAARGASAPAPGAAAEEAGEDAAAAVCMAGIPCVYSSEPARVKLLPLVYDAAAGESPADFGALAGFRVRVLPVLGTMPAMFGQAMASFVLCALAGAPLEPVQAIPLPLSSLKKLQCAAALFDQRQYGACAGPGWSRACGGVSMEEAEWCLSELWHQRSPLSGLRLGTRGVQMCLSRWRPWAGSVPSNTVLLEQHEAGALLAATTAASVLRLVGAAPGPLEAAFRAAAEGIVGGEAFERIEARLAWARAQGWA